MTGFKVYIAAGSEDNSVFYSIIFIFI